MLLINARICLVSGNLSATGDPPFNVIVGREGGERKGPHVVNFVNEGGLAEFYCVAEGDPTPRYRWTLASGEPLPDSAELFGVAGDILRLHNVTSTTCVRCIAYNSQGNSSAVQCLEVMGK